MHAAQANVIRNIAACVRAFVDFACSARGSEWHATTVNYYYCCSNSSSPAISHV